MSSSLPSSSSPRSSSSSLLVTSPLAPILLTPSMTFTTNALLSASSIAPTPRRLITPSAVLSSPVVDALILAPLTSVKSLSSDRTSLDAGISSDACASSISATSNQWYGSAPLVESAVQLGRNGGDSRTSSPAAIFFAFPLASARVGGGGGGAQAVVSMCVSWLMTYRRESGCSHGGGRMLARRCFLSSSASQRGTVARLGGRRLGVSPYKKAKKNWLALGGPGDGTAAVTRDDA